MIKTKTIAQEAEDKEISKLDILRKEISQLRCEYDFSQNEFRAFKARVERPSTERMIEDES